MGISNIHPRSARQTARLRQIVVISVICLAIYCFLLVPDESLDSSRSTNPEAYQSQVWPQRQREGGRHHALSPDLLSNRFLTESQCRASFPGLLDQVDNEVAKGPFKLEPYPSNLGPLFARIRDGQLYILSAARKADLSRDMLAHRSATLHQIANALLTWPRPASSPPSSAFSHIPDTIFAFNHHDDPIAKTFSYSRPADPKLLVTPDGEAKRFFPIPHFSSYSWALPFIGSLPRAARAISKIEASLSFSQKIPRAVWRGTTWFNNPRAGRLRQNLVRAFGPDSPGAGSHPWADIEALDWSPAGNGLNASNALRIEDFCRYKYIIHTEGVTYSGRFQFHNLCASVVITPPVAWIQHVTHLLRPVFSYTLDPSAPDSLSPPPSSASSSRDSLRPLFSRFLSSPEPQHKETKTTGLPRRPIELGGSEKSPSLSPYPAPWLRSAWPTEHDASEANIVFVAPDWSDLNATVAWLEAHPQIAEGIARRQRALFEDGGYFSPAAEMCYWRGLIQGWSKIVRIDDSVFHDLEEVTWEEFSLKEIHK
ncbi:hypothetical protein E0Z10_g5292 [Xylaria hypoxylon]|uniref:Glycosyl transferase CAP10 domain-containing protein n=1 Tax=Xylaria hypoxylon TaxID=37992 RepID=A0A4Z0YYA8_9PEZI|nr:hypothetical protein E0Z10_g5292 [Xylaria hypoxylon]